MATNHVWGAPFRAYGSPQSFLASESLIDELAAKMGVDVVGGGLSGLTAALDLDKKRYPVVIFEAQARLGGSLWDIPAARLPGSVIEMETNQVVDWGIDVRLNTPISANPDDGQVSLAQLQQEFDAMYLAVGAASPAEFALNCNGDGRITADPATCVTQLPGVFARPASGPRPSRPSPMAGGRRLPSTAMCRGCHSPPRAKTKAPTKAVYTLTHQVSNRCPSSPWPT